MQVAFGSAYRKHIVETIATIDLEADEIFTQSDALEDAAIILAPTTGWEQLLSSTPMNLAFLGQLLLLSLKRDFTLIPGNTHVGAIRLLKHPSSLRASIVQVSFFPYMFVSGGTLSVLKSFFRLTLRLQYLSKRPRQQ